MVGLVYTGLFVFSAAFALGAFLFGHDGGHDGGLDHGLDHGDIPSIFSSRVISLFLLGFSGVGVIATYVWKLSTGYASVCGLTAGAVMGGLAYGMIVLFTHEQASSLASASDYTDAVGRVCTAIPETGPGEISVTVKGQSRTVFAVSEDGKPVPEGRAVRVLRMAGGTATVRPE